MKHSSGKNDGSRHVKTYECPPFSIIFHSFFHIPPNYLGKLLDRNPQFFFCFSGSLWLVRNGRSLQEEMQTRGHKEPHVTGQNVGPGWTWVFGQTLDRLYGFYGETMSYMFIGFTIKLDPLMDFMVKPMLLWGVQFLTQYLIRIRCGFCHWTNFDALTRPQDFHQFSKSCPKFRLCGFRVASRKLKIHHHPETIKDSQMGYQKNHRFDLLVLPNHPIQGVSHSHDMSCPALASTKGLLADRVCRAREWICREPRIRVKDRENMYGCKLSMDVWIQVTLSTFAVQFQTPTGDRTPIDPSNQDQGAVLPVPGFSHVYLPHSRRFAGSCSFKLSVGWWRSVWTWVRVMIFSMIFAAQVPCMVVYTGSSNLVVPWQGWGFPCLALKTARLDRSFPMRDCRNQPPGPSVGI